MVYRNDARPNVESPPQRLGALEALFLAAIVCVALGLRFWGLEFGLGRLYHSDEMPKLERAQKASHSDFNPRHFKHPSFLHDVLSLIASIDPADPANPADWRRYHYRARAAIAILGAATLVPFYFAVRRLFGRPPAAFAAVLLAVAPLHVQTSHYVKEDVPLVFWLAIGLWACATLLESGALAAYLAAGVAAGGAVASKYTGVLAVVPLFAAHLARIFRRRDGRPVAQLPLVAALAAVPVVFLLFTPFALRSPNRFWDGVRSEWLHTRHGHGDVALWPGDFGFAFHLFHSVLPGLRASTTVLAVAAVGLALVRPSGRRAMLCAGALAFYFAVELSPTKPFPNFDRYALPTLLFVLPLAAEIVALAARAAAERWGGRAEALAWSAAVLFFAGPEAVWSVRFSAELVPDTRDHALAWFTRNVPAGRAIAVEGGPKHGPPLDRETYRLVPTWAASRLSRAELDAAELLVTSSAVHGRYLLRPEAFPREAEFYLCLSQRGRRRERFASSTGPYGFNNPTLEIYAAPFPVECQPHPRKPRRALKGAGRRGER